MTCGEEKAIFDEKWTNEAIWNLVDNAIKYTETGGVTITVREYEMFVCVEVSDTGCGISEAEQAQIFSRFYRSGKTSGKEGLGIGLYLARQIVTAEKGYIKLASKEGKGSVFFCSTLLHMLGGLDRPDEGTVQVDGVDIFTLKDEELTIF